MKVYVMLQPDFKTFFKVFGSIESIEKYFKLYHTIITTLGDEVDIIVKDPYTGETLYVGYNVWLEG